MGEVLDFGKFAKKDAVALIADKSACPSPILIERVKYDEVIMAFRADCFSSVRLGLSVGDIVRGQSYYSVYNIMEGSDYYKKNHCTFLIHVGEGATCGSLTMEDVLGQIVYLIVGEVYKKEIARCTDSSLKPLAGPKLQHQTVRKMSRNGVNDICDLMQMTRDELCEIPNMETYEVYQVEKYLNAKGSGLKPDTFSAMER